MKLINRNIKFTENGTMSDAAVALFTSSNKIVGTITQAGIKA